MPREATLGFSLQAAYELVVERTTHIEKTMKVQGALVRRGSDGKIRDGSEGWVKRGNVKEIQLQVREH